MNHRKTHNDAYVRLGVMVALSFVAMYGLMYAMVAQPDSIFNNINQVYMAALMAAAMLLISHSCAACIQ